MAIAQVNQEITVLCKYRQTKQTAARDREWKQSSLTNSMGVRLLYPAVPDYLFSQYRNKGPRFTSLSIDIRSTLAARLANSWVPDSLTATMTTAKYV